MIAMLRCGPSNRPFAATEKTEMAEFTHCGTKRPFAAAATADATNVGTCSAGHFAVQHFSPNGRSNGPILVVLKMAFLSGLF